MRPKRILVIVRGHLGDLIMALPALRDLRRALPQAHITAFVNEYIRGALDNCPFVDDLIYGFTYKDKSLPARLAYQTFNLAQIVGRYNIALCLRISPRTAPLVALLSGARVRVGYNQPGIFGQLLTRNLGREPNRTCNRTLHLNVVAALGGIQTNPTYPQIDWLSPQVRRETAALLAANGIRPGTRFAVVQLSCHWGCNEWQSEKWAALADYMAAAHNLRVVACGTGEAHEWAKYHQVAGLMKHKLVSLLGQTSIPQFIEVIGRANLALAADSALTQIALAQQTPSVILFGIEPIENNGPLPEEIGRLIEPIQHWEGPDKAPPPNPHCRFADGHCHTEFCRENSSMAQTSVKEVQERVKRLLGRS